MFWKKKESTKLQSCQFSYKMHILYKNGKKSGWANTYDTLEEAQTSKKEKIQIIKDAMEQKKIILVDDDLIIDGIDISEFWIDKPGISSYTKP